MAISSPLNPGTIVKERPTTAAAAQNFITGGSPLGSGVVASAANKIVGFQRGAAGVAARPPDLQSIIQTLSSNILNNVETRVQSINQNVTQLVNSNLKGLGDDYKSRLGQIDAARPNSILQNFLNLYKEAIGYIQFLGNRKNVKTLGNNLKALQSVFAETFNIAKLIRQTIIKIVKQLSGLPSASTGPGGINLDVNVPGGGLRRTLPKGVMKMMRRRPGMMLGGAALAGGLGSQVVSGMLDIGGDVQAAPMSEGTIPGTLLDRFSSILDRFSNAINSLTKKPQAAAAPSSGGESSSSSGEDSSDTGDVSGATPSASPGQLSESAAASSTAEGQVKAAGFDQADFTKFRDVIASKESKGVYDIQGGSGGFYSGRYQLGPEARQDAARFLGEKYQGDSESARQAFRKNPEMQERYFAAYTRANDSYLRGTPEYDALDKRGKLEVLAYAHNAGAGNAIKWLKGGRKESFKDGFGTKSATYAEAVRASFGGAPPPKLQQAAVTANPKVTPSDTQSTNAQQIAQTVSQPPPQQQTQVTVAPMNMASPQAQSTPATGKSIPAPAMHKGGATVPFLSSSNDDNFLSLYSKMVYNVIDG